MMRSLRKVAAADRLTVAAREHLTVPVDMARRVGVPDDEIGAAILRGALLNPDIEVTKQRRK